MGQLGALVAQVDPNSDAYQAGQVVGQLLCLAFVAAVVIGVVWLILRSTRSGAPRGVPPTYAQGATPPGWYPDPADATSQRWWDGRGWTDQTLGPPAPPPR